MPVSTQITSDPVTINGIDTATPISVSNGTYSVGCTGPYVSAPNTPMVSNGNTVCVRHTSAEAPSTPTDTVLTVGGVSDTFTSTTANAATTPVSLSTTPTSVTA